MKRNLYFALLIAFISTVGCGPQKAPQANTTADSLQNWALLPFNKVDSLNPVLVPGKGSFTDPILKTKVLWEEKDVFNPAIVNRNGKIYMLYRAQDKAGTSRIGMAVSSDALHFTRMPSPVFYPDQDSSKVLEWPGGCEDPRVAATQNGLYVLFYNGKNKSGEDGDMRYSPDSYCEGQVLFDSKDPSKPITRLDVPFLRPMESFKKSGQYANGTVFKGMAFFKKKWHLYYRCADSKVGVAIYDPSVHAPPYPIILNTTS